MKILFDHNVSRRFRKYLVGHNVMTTREMGWEELANGELLAAAARAGFEVILTIDKKLEHEQNLEHLPLPVIVLDSPSNALPALVPFAAVLLELLNTSCDRALYVVERDGNVLRLTSPRL